MDRYLTVPHLAERLNISEARARLLADRFCSHIPRVGRSVRLIPTDMLPQLERAAADPKGFIEPAVVDDDSPKRILPIGRRGDGLDILAAFPLDTTDFDLEQFLDVVRGGNVPAVIEKAAELGGQIYFAKRIQGAGK